MLHLLERFDLVETDRSLHREAGLLPGRRLHNLDALHLATALRVGADVMVTYGRVSTPRVLAAIPIALIGVRAEHRTLGRAPRRVHRLERSLAHARTGTRC
ncbi:MAG: hypothetical protein JO364_15825 [Pseudonocardiales bacterium]|nr:hypothetical protein [Pseudonocardiales bacterium]MBV8539781.1 hypothetical protein [Pseudonocardiales bacterium]MBV9031737.1 hypothetical protein [Pseudonocardiales bacterium]